MWRCELCSELTLEVKVSVLGGGDTLRVLRSEGKL
jgi:hypothetical protein